MPPAIPQLNAAATQLFITTSKFTSTAARPTFSQAADAAAWRCRATPLAKGTDGVRVGHRQTSPAGDVGGPLQLQRRGSPTIAGATDTARHQAAGAAADRHNGECILHSNPRLGGSRSELGAGSLANANSFRAAMAHVQSAQVGRVGLVVVASATTGLTSSSAGTRGPGGFQEHIYIVASRYAHALLPRVMTPSACLRRAAAASSLPPARQRAPLQGGHIAQHGRWLMRMAATTGSHLGLLRDVAEDHGDDEGKPSERPPAGGSKCGRRRGRCLGVAPPRAIRSHVDARPPLSRPTVASAAARAACRQSPLALPPRPCISFLARIRAANAADDPGFPSNDGVLFGTTTAASFAAGLSAGAATSTGTSLAARGLRPRPSVAAVVPVGLWSGHPPGMATPSAHRDDTDNEHRGQQEDRPACVNRVVVVHEHREDKRAIVRLAVTTMQLSRIGGALRLENGTANGPSCAAPASDVGARARTPPRRPIIPRITRPHATSLLTINLSASGVAGSGVTPVRTIVKGAMA